MYFFCIFCKKNIFNCHLQLFKFSFLHFLYSLNAQSLLALFAYSRPSLKCFLLVAAATPNQQLKSNSSAVNIRQCYSGIDHIISSFKKISCRTNVYHSSNFSSICKYMYLYIFIHIHSLPGAKWWRFHLNNFESKAEIEIFSCQKTNWRITNWAVVQITRSFTHSDCVWRGNNVKYSFCQSPPVATISVNGAWTNNGFNMGALGTW